MNEPARPRNTDRVAAGDLTPFLTATEFIDASHPSILGRVRELALPSRPIAERAIHLFRHVRDEIQYEFMAKLSAGEYRASHVLAVGRGFCVQKAMLLCALGRAAGVPTALVFSDVRDHTLSDRITGALGTNVLHYHGLNAFFLEERWVRVDASLSPDLVARKGYRPVEFDGTHEALLPRRTVAGRPHAEYLRFHGLCADLPFTPMILAFTTAYGEADLSALADLARFF